MKEKTKSRIGFGVAAVLIIVLIAVIAIFSWLIHSASDFDSDPDGDAGTIVVDGTSMDGIDWDYWLSVNPDIVGWIRIPDTDIDFPIVHAPDSDPDYYLSHDIYKNYNPLGAIYLDCDCTGLFDGGNSVVFGHHYSHPDRMFATMAKYSNKTWASEHSCIYIFTPDDETHVLDVQAADVIPGTSAVKRTSFEDEADLMAYWQERYDACDMQLVDEAAETNQLFTFVTCSYNFWTENERTLTYAIPEESLATTAAIEAG